MNHIMNFKEHKQHGTSNFPIAVYDSTESIPYQWHQEYEFVYMVDGYADYHVNGKAVPLHSGDCAFCQGGNLHSMLLAENQKIQFKALVFHPEYLFMTDDICHQYFYGKLILQQLFTSKIKEENEIIQFIKSIFVAFETQTFGYELEIKSLLLQIFSHIFKHELYTPIKDTTSQNLIKKNLITVTQYVHTHYTEKITVQTLADLIGYSASHFTRFFKEATGKSPIEYLIFYRLYQSCELLKHTELSILEIAWECGFFNVNYFIRTFKKFYTDTPYQYRLKGEIQKTIGQF